MNDLVVAVTGASGGIYVVRLLEVLLAAGRRIHLTISPAAAEVIRQELGLKVDLEDFRLSQLLPSDPDFPEEFRIGLLEGMNEYPGGHDAPASIFSESEISHAAEGVTYHHYRDFSAGIASGSFLTAGMVICPCSMGTLSSLATGQSSNLIHRAADVHLKERRKLIVVPRETPLGAIQLENMRRLCDAGAVVLPAMPGFYHQPSTIHDLVDFVVGRICDQLGVDHELFRRWGG